MRRDGAEPGDAGVAQGNIRVEAARDSTRDQGLALLGEQGKQALLGGNQRVNPRRLPVQIVRNGSLVRNRRNTDSVIKDKVFRNTLLASGSGHAGLPELPELRTRSDVVQKATV